MSEDGITRRQVGYVHVDSGQLFIIDPGKLDDWKPGEYTGEGEPTNSFARVTQFLFDNDHGEVEKGVIVGLDSDGSYPVFVVEDKNMRVLRIEIGP